MIRRLIILLLIVGCDLIFPQLKNYAIKDSLYKQILLDTAAEELKYFIKGEINQELDNYYEKKIWKRFEDNVYSELESIINTDKIIIEFKPHFLLISWPSTISKFFNFDVFEEYYDSYDSEFSDEDSTFTFLMPIFSEEKIKIIRENYIHYKNKFPKLKENEVYNNYIVENNIVNNENHISTNLIREFVTGVGKRHFNLYIDNNFSNSKEKIIITIINSIYPETHSCDKCINFIYTNIDSLKRVENMENGISSLSKENIYDKSYAIIIGIDDYQNISNLDYAVNDAESVKEMLINQFSYEEENVKLLINENANKINIEQTLSDISLLAGENDRILVFFAGHGETMKLPDGGEMGYLIPVDGRQENLYASAIPMNDLKDLSHMSKAKHMLFLVDACYGGLAAVGTRGLEPAKTPNYLEKITNIKSRQIITAGGSDEKVIEKPEWGHSAYTMNLLRALKDGLADTNGDGYITAGELGLYLNEKVTIDSENQQTPQSRRLTSHEGEFIFFSD